MKKIILALALAMCMTVANAKERRTIDLAMLDDLQELMMEDMDNNMSPLLKYGNKIGLSYVGTQNLCTVLSNNTKVLTAKTVPSDTMILTLLSENKNSSVDLIGLSSYYSDEMSSLLDQLDSSNEYKYIESTPFEDRIEHAFYRMYNDYILIIRLTAYTSGYWTVSVMHSKEKA